MLSTTSLDTPIGPLTLVAGTRGLRAVLFPGEPVPAAAGADPGDGVLGDGVLADAVTQLTEYFEGRRRTFALALDIAGTPFARRVWSTLAATVPYGSTTTYGALAQRLGDGPAMARAVGAANGRTPVPIVIPCHRVIGAGGALTGYRGGLDRKQALLALERRSLRRGPLSLRPAGGPGASPS